MKLIKFIEMPDQLSNLDMDALRGGLRISNDCGCQGTNCGTYTKSSTK